ncbi:type I methionyl aminopeptidase [Patescibacteria group bacterium]|nr:type I methionyl aminopeptidase [Patescibacteria group bacterium]MBU4023117.1 type I methionyl aminopeptidase [Patescibacteria group bacterium]MBU4078452.1 type I methionyl aminopeptidase [Patescibacteria group bacterium]
MIIKTEQEIKIITQAGKILADIIRELKKEVKPGIKTIDLDKLAQELIFKSKTQPGFLDYKGFPAILCTSVNEVIVHGLPSDYVLKNGDILSLDLGIIHNGYYADMAITVPIGEISREAQVLIRAVKKSLNIAIKKARPGNTTGDIGNTIQRYLEKRGLNVVKDLCGHGIGKKLHEEPEILNYGKRKKGEILKQGMVLCLEPMATIGKAKIKKAGDGFGFKTIDDSLSAHFEHMIVITQNGSRVLTG